MTACLLALTSPARAAEPSGGAGLAERALSDSAELERVIELYLSGQYEICAEVLEPLVTPGRAGAFTDPSVLERGRLYLASCATLSGHNERARTALHAALESNPLMPAPDSLTFPPPVLALFLEVREEVQSLIAKKEQEQVARLLRENEQARRREAEREARVAELRRLAEEEPVVARNSRWVACLPFGAGQFQNGAETLGTTFLVSEIALSLGVVASTTALLSAYAGGGLNAEGHIPPNAASRFEVPNVLLTASGIGLVSVMALGILEANLAYQPERRLGTRRRVLPPELREESGRGEGSRASGPRPFGAASPEGAFFGLSGTF